MEARVSVPSCFPFYRIDDLNISCKALSCYTSHDGSLIYIYNDVTIRIRVLRVGGANSQRRHGTVTFAIGLDVPLPQPWF